MVLLGDVVEEAVVKSSSIIDPAGNDMRFP